MHRRDEWAPCGNRDQPASGSAQQHQKRGDDGRRAVLQPARRAAADQVANDEPEIEAASMNQQALEDIRVAAQMRAAHPARVVEMRKGAFDPLAPLTHQATAARSTNPPPIGIHRGLGLGEQSLWNEPADCRYISPGTASREGVMKPVTILSWGYWGWGNSTPQLREVVDAVEKARGFKPPLFVDIRFKRQGPAPGLVADRFANTSGRRAEALLSPGRFG